MYNRAVRELNNKLGVGMIRLFTSFSRQGWGVSNNYYLMRCQVASKTSKIFIGVKWEKKDLEKAKDLIFGEREYQDFSLEERRLVDSYQEQLLKIDGGVILPNTRFDLEQREIELLSKSN